MWEFGDLRRSELNYSDTRHKRAPAEIYYIFGPERGLSKFEKLDFVGFIVGDDGGKVTGGNVVVILNCYRLRGYGEFGFDDFGGSGKDVLTAH